MGCYYFVITVALSLSRYLSVTTDASASEPNRKALIWKMQSNFRQSQKSHSTKPRINENQDLRTSQDWPQSCLQISDNQTVEDTRKEYIAALNGSLFEQFNVNKIVSSTNQRNSRFRDESVRKRGKSREATDKKNKIMKQRVFFPNTVRRRKNSRGVVIRFVLSGNDIPRKLTSIQLFAYNVCKRTAVKPVLILKLHNKNKTKEKKCGKRIVNLYRYHNSRRLLYDSTQRNTQYKGWIAFNLTVPVKAVWQNMKHVCKSWGKNKLSLIIRSPKCISPAAQRITGGKKWKPYLEMVSADNPPEGRKKYSPPLECTPGEKRCCLQKSIVSLKGLGDWTSQVIHPKVFSGAYCRGSCSENALSSRSHQNVNQPCCIPTKTSALSALYFEAGTISMKNLPDVLVRECGCV